MRSHSTRETVRNLDKAEFLGASTRTHMPIVSPKLTETYSVLPPVGEGEAPRSFDWNGFQGSNADLLDFSSGNVRTRSHDYRVAKVKVFEARRRRDKKGNELRTYHRSMRNRFLAGYDEDDLDLVALESPPSQRIGDLREQCHDFVERARDPELPAKLGEPKTPSAAMNFPDQADEFEVHVGEYDRLMLELKEAEKVRDEERAALKAAKALNRRIYTNVARIQEGLYRLAGLDDLADRIRMTIPVRSSRSGSETDSSPGEPADTAPDTVPPDTVPPDTVPADTVPGNTAPADTSSVSDESQSSTP